MLRTKLVPLRWTQVVHFDHDTLPPRNRITLVIARNGKLPASAASGAFALPATDAEEILRHSGIEAWVIKEATGSAVSVAITRAKGVASAVGGEGGFVRLSESEGGDGEYEEFGKHDCGGVHGF